MPGRFCDFFGFLIKFKPHLHGKSLAPHGKLLALCWPFLGTTYTPNYRHVNVSVPNVTWHQCFIFRGRNNLLEVVSAQVNEGTALKTIVAHASFSRKWRLMRYSRPKSSYFFSSRGRWQKHSSEKVWGTNCHQGKESFLMPPFFWFHKLLSDVDLFRTWIINIHLKLVELLTTPSLPIDVNVLH